MIYHSCSLLIHAQELVIRDVSGVLVTSGSLPRSLRAKFCDTRDSDLGEEDVPEFLSDQQCTSTEVSSSNNKADCESCHSGFCFQVAASTHTEPSNTTATACQSSTNEASLVDSILAVAMRHLDPHESEDLNVEKSAQSTTPLSPPRSHYAVPSSDISTSSSYPQVVASTSQKRLSIEEERQRRRSNIEESTRAALSVSICSDNYVYKYMLLVYAKYRLGQSIDCPAPSTDPHLAQTICLGVSCMLMQSADLQSMDCVVQSMDPQFA